MSKSVLPRLAAAVALAVALLLAAASPASAAAFNPIKYKYNSAAPVTAKVASMRSAAGAVVLDWKKQVTRAGVRPPSLARPRAPRPPPRPPAPPQRAPSCHAPASRRGAPT